MSTGSRVLFSDDAMRDIALQLEKDLAGKNNWIIIIDGNNTAVGFSHSVISTIKMGIDIVPEVIASVKDELAKFGIKINNAEENELKKLLRSIT